MYMYTKAESVVICFVLSLSLVLLSWLSESFALLEVGFSFSFCEQ